MTNMSKIKGVGIKSKAEQGIYKKNCRKAKAARISNQKAVNMKNSRDNALMQISVGAEFTRQMEILTRHISCSKTISYVQFERIFTIMKKIQQGLQGMLNDNEKFREHLNNKAYARKILKPYAILAKETAAEINKIMSE